MYVCLDLFYIK